VIAAVTADPGRLTLATILLDDRCKQTRTEPRWLVIGRIDAKHWSVVVTYRQGRARIISARRSRKEEVALYEG
jgi:uncharacterized DUF497 family protein